MKTYKIKIVSCAFGIHSETVKTVTEAELLRWENQKNGTYYVEILEIYE